MVYPKMYAVRQAFAREREEDVPGSVRRELQRVASQTKLRPGASVAIAVGSRGIRNLATIVRGVVDGLKQMKAKPFIFPAMGSHGGGTAEGQASVLQHYGITEQAIGCPVRAGMETVRIGQSGEGIPVFLDLHASRADHVVAINRIKSHTEFKGEIESGIMKMLLIGMGKHEGARTYHRAFADYGFDRIVESVAPVVIKEAKVLFGLAIVENAYNETTLIRSLLPGEITRSEKALLLKAKELAPRLPFDEIDILIVDAMGKNISGSGMDTNVIGRFYNMAAREPARPRIKRIYVRDLTPESLGNGCGIGLADFAHHAVVDKMDVSATNTNCLTAVNPEKARIPIVADSDRQALDFCFGTIGLTAPEDARVVRIHNTLDLTELEISHTLMGLTQGRTDLEIAGGPAPLDFDAGGTLRPWCTDRMSTVAG
jgi:hypothetical protein